MGGFLSICAVTHRSLIHWPSKEGSVVCVCVCVCVRERERDRQTDRQTERQRGAGYAAPDTCRSFCPEPHLPAPNLTLFAWLTPHPSGFNLNVSSERLSLTQASSTTADLSPTSFFHSPHPFFSTVSLTSSHAVFVYTFLNIWLPHNTGNPPPLLQPRGRRRVGMWRVLSKHPGEAAV